MKRLIAVLALGVTVNTLVLGVAAGAPAAKPYVGSWKAKVTADLLFDNGIVQPKMRGTWRLELNGDGTYRMYNPLGSLDERDVQRQCNPDGVQ